MPECWVSGNLVGLVKNSESTGKAGNDGEMQQLILICFDLSVIGRQRGMDSAQCGEHGSTQTDTLTINDAFDHRPLQGLRWH